MTTNILQTIELVLGITPATHLSTDSVLGRIRDYISKKKSAALDRLQFDECRQESNETFEQFFLRLQKVAACADLCVNCYDERMTTRIIARISDNEARKKLLAMDTFPMLRAAVELCRAEEAACRKKPMLHRRTTAPVNVVGSNTNKGRQEKRRRRSISRGRKNSKNDSPRCGRRGHELHEEGKPCQAAEPQELQKVWKR